MYLLLLTASAVSIGFHWHTVNRWKKEAERKAEGKGFNKGYQMGLSYGREMAEFWKEEE